MSCPHTFFSPSLFFDFSHFDGVCFTLSRLAIGPWYGSKSGQMIVFSITCRAVKQVMDYSTEQHSQHVQSIYATYSIRVYQSDLENTHELCLCLFWFVDPCPQRQLIRSIQPRVRRGLRYWRRHIFTCENASWWINSMGGLVLWFNAMISLARRGRPVTYPSIMAQQSYNVFAGSTCWYWVGKAPYHPSSWQISTHVNKHTRVWKNAKSLSW